jgi:predicted Zn-dependent protease
LVARDPTNRDALLDLGGALLRLERYADAVPYFERAIAAGADSPLAWNGLATAKINTNDRAGAARALRRSLQLEPDQSDARAALKALVP